MTSIKDRLIIKLANHVTVAKGKKAMAHLQPTFIIKLGL